MPRDQRSFTAAGWPFQPQQCEIREPSEHDLVHRPLVTSSTGTLSLERGPDSLFTRRNHFDTTPAGLAIDRFDHHADVGAASDTARPDVWQQQDGGVISIE